MVKIQNYLSNKPKMRSVHAFFAEMQLFEGRNLKTPIFWKNCLKFSDWKKQKNEMKIEDQEGGGG